MEKPINATIKKTKKPINFITGSFNYIKDKHTILFEH